MLLECPLYLRIWSAHKGLCHQISFENRRQFMGHACIA